MSPRFLRPAAACVLAALATACGSSSSSPTTPSTSTTPTTTNVLAAPTVFLQSSQKINRTTNELTFTWTGNSSTYQFVVGTSPGSAQQTFQVTGNTYTWTSPQAGGAYYARVAATQSGTVGTYSDELSLFVLDIRNVIDALFFRSGPMADNPANGATNPTANIWADGTVLSVLVSTDAGDTARANAQTFVNDYAALVGNGVTGTATLTSNTMQGSNYPSLFPDFTIGVRIQAGFCGGALGCVPIVDGPSRKKAIVTLEQGSGLYLGATAHEMGHAYGLGHVTRPAAGRPEFRFMMNPSYTNEQMTDVEKLAISYARELGIRPGMTRNEAISRGLVNQ